MSTIYEYIHIVFGIEHYNPLGLVRSLGEAGIQPIGIIINQNSRPLTSKSKYLKEVHIVSSIEEGYNFLLKKYGNEKNKPFVYTADDKITSFLDAHYEELASHFTFFNAGENNRITEYMNKKNILECAERNGLSVLNTIVVKKGEIPAGITYPIITKAIVPTIGAWKNDMVICNNEDELREAYKSIASEEVLIQKYIIKKNEYCMEGFSSNRGSNLFISIVSTYDYLIPNSYSPFMSVKNLDRMEIIEPLKNMFKEIGYEGIFEIEFLIDQDDTLYFGEINFRNSTWSYASTCANMNLPVLWATSMITKKIDSNWYKTVPSNFKAIVEIPDYLERVKGHKVSFIHWLIDLKKCKCKYYLGRHDLKPIICFIASKVKG